MTTYFSKTTGSDYLKGCFLKACKIHTKLPDGGILIFVTGQAEVNYLVNKLRKTFPYNQQSEPENCKDNNLLHSSKNKNFKKFRGRICNMEINLDK